MVKFSCIGSCLTAQIAMRLSKRGLTFLGSLRHIRSDVFIDNFDEDTHKVGGLEEEDIIRLLLTVKNKYTEIKLNKIENILRCNSKEYYLRFVEAIKNSDYLIFDNQYDLVRSKGTLQIDEKQYLLSNLFVALFGFPSNSQGLLPDDMLGNYNVLDEVLCSINPNIKLIFVQYPIVNGENLSVDRHSRVLRSHLTAKFRSQWKFISTPLYKIDLEYTSENNINHFKPVVYDYLGSIVYEIINNGASHEKEDVVGLKGFCTEKVSNTPYSDLPTRQYWKPAVSEVYPLAISDLYRKKYAISRQDAIATCGSCFAQHIGKRLREGGYNYLDLEPAPTGLLASQAKAQGYGLYSARYGNVYTSRQLLQLHQRAFEELYFDEAWPNTQGRYVDPFRPNLCGEGYPSPKAMLADQAEHLSQVRRMFETLDVFVFTMGLTETWYNRESSAVYPICPGVTSGNFDSGRHAFVNLDYVTMLEEMEQFLARLKDCNPKARVLLTVSPVPLTATAEDRHVLLSTMASKSILRSVADRLYQLHEHVDYFPSYDIILSPPYKSMFFKNNLRSIHDEGVDHVMTHFFAQHRLDCQGEALASADASSAIATRLHDGKTENSAEEGDEEFCDEAFLELERLRNIQE